MLQAVCKYWMSRSYDVYILMQHRHDLQVFYHGLLIILCIFTSKIPKVQLYPGTYYIINRYIQQLCMHEIIRYLLLRYPGSTKFYSTYY